MSYLRISCPMFLRSARLAWLVALACGGSPEAGLSPEQEGASSQSNGQSGAPRRSVDPSGDGEPDGSFEATSIGAERVGDESVEDGRSEATTFLSAFDPASAVPRVVVGGGAFVGAALTGVERFLGIPYARPPVGSLRFQPPVPAAAPETELDATAASSACLQVDGTADRGSEDCLYLNVYRPAGTDAASNLPVMVWIHGGSFVHGAGIDYDPQRLVDQNQIVVVTINYRLGALGFLALPATDQSPGLSGSYGLMDQQEALRWVKKNILSFGGDPGQVTIQGQSAGGVSVCAQLASPLAAGLFSQAAIQSGGCLARTFAEAAGPTYGTAFAGKFPQCRAVSDVAECLRGLEAEEIRDVTGASVAQAIRWGWGPVVDGVVLPEAPADVVRRKGQHRVPVLIGGISDETRGFLAAYRDGANADYAGTIAAYFGGVVGAEVVKNYPQENYAEPFLGLTAAVSDRDWACGTALLADQFASTTTTTTYAYELDDPSFEFPNYLSPVPGATHSADLPFLFEAVMFDAGISNKSFNGPQQALADQMVRAWGEFIKTGNPSTDDVAWPSYTTGARTMLHLEPGAVATTGNFRERHKCAAWGF